MPPLPNANSSPYPSYPSQSNPSMPMPSYPTQSNPSMPSYPRQQQAPPFGAGFVAPQPNAPPFGGGYPPQMPNPYPTSSTTVYPTIPNQSHIPNSNILPHQQGYSGYGYQQVPSSGPSYPINNMAPSFSQMQGHIKDVRRSKVCVFYHLNTSKCKKRHQPKQATKISPRNNNDMAQNAIPFNSDAYNFICILCRFLSNEQTQFSVFIATLQ